MAYILTPEECLLQDAIKACCTPEVQKLLIQLGDAASRARNVGRGPENPYSHRLKKAVHRAVIYLEPHTTNRDELDELVTAFRAEET